jgi:hypothetical protein
MFLLLSNHLMHKGIIVWHGGLVKASRQLLQDNQSGNESAVVGSKSRTPHPSRRREGPISKHVSGLGTNKNMVIISETKNGCAGEGQWKITALLSCDTAAINGEKNMRCHILSHFRYFPSVQMSHEYVRLA